MRLGRYLLGERLSVGGMGEVRLGKQLGLGEYEKPLALKLLLPHLASDEAAVKMFLDEARLASRMNHPNVVKIFDVGEEQGLYFIAMELIRGVSMSSLIRAFVRQKEVIPAGVLEYVGRALCEGLHHAHELAGPDGAPLGLVHRDVTPHNVMLSIHGEVKLTDFGIARARDTTSFTEPGQVRGKLAYLAPEQLRDVPLDRRVDLFGAAVSLFQLATGVSPFSRSTDGATLMAVQSDPLPSLAELRPDLSGAFVSAIHRATSKDPRKRFASAREFRDAMAHATSSEAAETLGAIVRVLCGEEVARMEQSASVLTVRERGLTASITQEGDDRKPAFWTRARISAVVVASSLLLAGGQVLFSPEPSAGEASAEEVASTALAPVPVAQRAAPVEPPATDAGTAVEPAAPATPQPAAASRTVRRSNSPGYLSVDASPWALVYVDGKKIGETPIARFPISAGRATVLLVNPDSGKRATRRALIRSGKVSRVKVDLQ